MSIIISLEIILKIVYKKGFYLKAHAICTVSYDYFRKRKKKGGYENE